MPWQRELARRAIRDLERLPDRDRGAVEAAIDRLVADPGSVDLAKLAGQDQWRMRVGNWRVFLELDNAVGQIRILRVLRRTSTTY
jgi:mRNA interferase RelE/StbE